MSGRLHAPAALYPGKLPPSPTEETAGWDLGPVWTFRTRGEYGGDVKLGVSVSVNLSALTPCAILRDAPHSPNPVPLAAFQIHGWSTSVSVKPKGGLYKLGPIFLWHKSGAHGAAQLLLLWHVTSRHVVW